MGKVRNICVLRLGAMGDVLFTTPALRGLRAKYPGARVTYLTLRQWRFLLRRNSNVDRVVGLGSMDPSALGALARERFDLVVNFQDIEEGARICEALSADERRGNRWIDGRLAPGAPQEFPNITEEAAMRRRMEASLSMPDLLCRVAGVDFDGRGMDYDPGRLSRWRARRVLGKRGLPRAGKNLVAMHIHSRGSEARCWRAEDALEVVRTMRDEAHFLVLGYAPDRAATQLLEAEPNATVSFDRIWIQAAMLPQCRAFLGIDSGPRNVASALGVRSVGLFGPTGPSFLPRFEGDVFLQSPHPPAPWMDQREVEAGSFLKDIPHEEIVEALRTLL